jgi:hypothetical protein
MSPGGVVIHVVRHLATVREGLLSINHNGRTWVRDLILHGGRGNRGVGRMGRTREIASTHRRRGQEGRRNIFRWVVNGGGGMSQFADQSTHQATWLLSVAQGWPVFLQGCNFVGQPTHQPDDFDEGRLPGANRRKDGTLPGPGLAGPGGKINVPANDKTIKPEIALRPGWDN